jgi:hypothetical protein
MREECWLRRMVPWLQCCRSMAWTRLLKLWPRTRTRAADRSSGAPRRRPGSPIHQTRLRLEQALSSDRPHGGRSTLHVVHPGRRGRGLRSGWRRDLRRAPPPRHRQCCTPSTFSSSTLHSDSANSMDCQIGTALSASFFSGLGGRLRRNPHRTSAHFDCGRKSVGTNHGSSHCQERIRRSLHRSPSIQEEFSHAANYLRSDPRDGRGVRGPQHVRRDGMALTGDKGPAG